jgi:hypothetical protein
MRCLISMLFATSLLLVASGATADPNLNCDAYAGAAVAQQLQNMAQGCGFAGPAWSTDFAGHRNWCLAPATTMANLAAEDQARQSALAQCASKPKVDQAACQTYANRALMVANAAAQRQCGFGGGRWSLDYGTHFDWCLGAPQSARDQEDKARTDQFDACSATQAAAADQARKDACGKYAAIAVDQQKENEGRQCEFTGGRWAGDWFAHFDWCMGAGPEAGAQETALRATALQNDCMYLVCHTDSGVFSSTTSCKNQPKPWK